MKAEYITEYYDGFLVSDLTYDGLNNKKRKIDIGDQNGFIRVENPNVCYFIEKLQHQNKELTLRAKLNSLKTNKK